MAAFGEFGETLGSLERSPFFSWFSFRRVAEGAYRPSREAFAELVWLVGRTAEKGRLDSLTLAIARPFIGDPRQGAFARDLAKSFFAAVAGRDRDLLEPLIDEIFFRDAPHPVLMGNAPPQLPSAASAGYLAFVGEGPAWSRGLPDVRLTMEDRDADGVAQLVITATRVETKRGWWARLLGR